MADYSELIDRLRDYLQAYPEDIFPTPPPEHQALNSAAAHVMRRLALPIMGEAADAIERLRAENATVQQMIDACPIDLDDGTSIRRVKETHQDFCRVHGSALCPESYMLDSSGRPWAEYADSWDETMRCNRRSALYVEATDD